MAGLAAVNQVGEAVAGLLRARRDLLTAEGRLGPVPAALAINQASLSGFAVQPEPTAGCTLTCYRIAMSDHPTQRAAPRDATAAAVLSVELRYLVTAWAASAADEQAIISWVMLELFACPLLDQSLLPRDGSWARGESVQIVPDSVTDDALFRLWGALQHKLRLCATFTARVVRIGYGGYADYPPAVASRFAFDSIDPAAVAMEPA